MLFGFPFFFPFPVALDNSLAIEAGVMIRICSPEVRVMIN